jgi:glycerol-3-phosphate dehydrogenase
MAFRKRSQKPPRCPTEEMRVPGGDIDDMEAFLAGTLRDRPGDLDEAVLLSLARNHGTCYREVLDYENENPDLGRPLAGTHVLRAEVVHALRHEMALTLSDVALRRTDLASGGSPGDAALEECASVAAAEMGWSEAQRRSELDDLRAVFPSWSRSARRVGEGSPA